MQTAMNIKLLKFLYAMLFAGSALLLTSCGDDDDDDEGNGPSETPQSQVLDDGTIQYNGTADGTGSVTWTADNQYLLNGFVFVNPGDTLTIEPGTIIRAKASPDNGDPSSALIVARGGYIMAEGTAQAPIIFTAEADTDVNDPSDIPSGQRRGLWGGLIVLGNAQLNSDPGETQIEGIPTSEERGLYGGSDDNDNSGVLQYVSIRHGGSEIGAGNEINGLTLGAVGSGTTIDYVEVIYNQDDGVEWFGGTASAKHLVVAFSGDDSYDYDEGYRGKNQFLLAIDDTDDGDRGGEHDGGTDPEDGTPYTTPVFYNATYIGGGIPQDKRTITFRDNAGGEYHNSIFMEYGRGIDIENLQSGEDSYSRFLNGELAFRSNVIYNIGSVDSAAVNILTVQVDTGEEDQDGDPIFATDDTANVTIRNAFANAFELANAMPIQGLSRTNDGGLNLLAADIATSGAAAPGDSFFEAVDYRGAFGTVNWLSGWSYLSTNGYTTD